MGKSVIIVLQSLVLRRCKLIQTAALPPAPIHQLFKPFFEIFSFSKTEETRHSQKSPPKKNNTLCLRAKCLFFESSGKKEYTKIFLLTTHKYCQDGGFKLKQMS